MIKKLCKDQRVCILDVIADNNDRTGLGNIFYSSPITFCDERENRDEDTGAESEVSVCSERPAAWRLVGNLAHGFSLMKKEKEGTISGSLF